MKSKTLNVSEDALISMLKTLPEDALIDVFWKTLVGYDASQLTDEERRQIETGKAEFKKGKTVKWEDIK